ncbi:MAG: 6-carboxytetrahydropterin synthase [Sedimentisphaerales bacterium]|nr:6-carboxytetrahydropterin synthase [Sedimentisphaerales bacterium]
MHKLTRHVRFSVNPFLPEDEPGYNSFVSKPAGEGLAIFFELSAEVTGEVEPATGFVINVTDIDKRVREFAVPVFAERIRRKFRQAKHIGLPVIAELLVSARERLAESLGSARLSRLSVKLNPSRNITIDSKDPDMVFFSEKFEFAATHKLWNDDFSEEWNFDVFGKCANPTGHGHNYVVEVAIKMPAGKNGFRIGQFEKIVDEELIRLIDHKNLNADLDEFRKTNPTIENIAVFAWNKLVGKFDEATLHCVSIWETDKTYCSYYG